LLSSKLLPLALLGLAAHAQLLQPIHVNPSRIAADSNPTVITVHGSGFTSGVVVEWNGQPRPTTFVNATNVTVTLSASDLTFPALGNLSVWDATGSTQLSADVAVVIYLAINNNDIVLDATRERIYIAVSAQQKPQGQSIAVLNPETEVIESYYPLDAEPQRLAVSDDGQYLYVAMSNKIERINLNSWTTEATIPTSSSVLSMVVLPGLPQSIAVSFSSGGSPSYGGTQVFDGTQQRMNIKPFSGPNYLVGGPNAELLYGYDGSGTLYNLSLSPSSIQIASTSTIATGPVMPVYAGGLLYMWDAAVDPTVWRVTQTFGIGGVVGPFAALNRILVLEVGDVLFGVNLGNVLALVDVNTGARIWTLPFPALPSYSNGIMNDPIITWGANGVAFRDNTGEYSIFNSPSILLFRVNVSETASSPFANTGPSNNIRDGSRAQEPQRSPH
jgi:hypothetical protein